MRYSLTGALRVACVKISLNSIRNFAAIAVDHSDQTKRLHCAASKLSPATALLQSVKHKAATRVQDGNERRLVRPALVMKKR